MKEEYNILVTTAFGLESIVKKECENLCFKNLTIENGKINFRGTQEDIVKANLWLRSADRVFIKLLEFKALSYDDIYDNVKSFNWEDYLSKDGQFIVLGKSHNSKMYSISDNQSITKKAIVDRLSKIYNISWFSETNERYKITIDINNDIASILMDTSGEGLHKRGYRLKQNEAPIKETLAAAMLQIAGYTGDRPFVDPFSGSGTIPIEAAFIAKNIAPGISRKFDFQFWPFFDENIYKKEKADAFSKIKDIKPDIMGFDINRESTSIAIQNAINAGVDDSIKFITKDISKVGLKNNFGMIVSNPPYGIRIGDESQMNHIYDAIKTHIKNLSTWSFYFITSDKDFERKIYKKSDKKRKLYNGKIEVDYYQFIGPTPLNILLEDFDE